MKHKEKPPLQDGIAGVPPVAAPLNDHERAVIAALREVAYGEIEVIVHNAKIVQITRSQKFRFAGR
ncbi:MAG: DUF2292 domain-containing protein [Pseudomonadota bacterium]